MQRMVTCTLISSIIKSWGSCLRRTGSGEWLFRCSGDSKLCTLWRSFTGISKLLMYSWLVVRKLPSLETWMSLRLRRRVSSIHRLELLTMQVLRSGETILMITRATFGAWGASSTKWLPWSLRSGQRLWNFYTRRSWPASTPESQEPTR